MKKINCKTKAFQKSRNEKIKRNKATRLKKYAYLKHMAELQKIWVMKNQAAEQFNSGATV